MLHHTMSEQLSAGGCHMDQGYSRSHWRLLWLPVCLPVHVLAPVGQQPLRPHPAALHLGLLVQRPHPYKIELWCLSDQIKAWSDGPTLQVHDIPADMFQMI